MRLEVIWWPLKCHHTEKKSLFEYLDPKSLYFSKHHSKSISIRMVISKNDAIFDFLDQKKIHFNSSVEVTVEGKSQIQIRKNEEKIKGKI